MKKYFHILIIGLLLFNSCEFNSTEPEEQLIGIPVLDIIVDKDDYLDLLSNKTVDLETDCKFSYNGELFKGNISSSGAGSRYADKWSYKIEVEDGKLIEGLNEFNLSSQYSDYTKLKTLIASKLYRQAGFPVPFSKHVFVRVNGKDKGLYPLIERVEEEFFTKRNLPVAELFKLGFDSKFTFEVLNNVQFVFEKKIPDDNNFNSLIEMIHSRDISNPANVESELGRFLDIENYLKYHAVTTLLNNIDAFTNNFFLVKEYPGSSFKVIPWDFDKCFYGLPEAPLAGYNQLITKLLSNNSILNKYKQLLILYNNTLFNESNIFPIIDSTAVLIKEAYKRDPYLGKAGHNLDDEIQKLKNYIAQRHKYIEDNADSYQCF